MIFELASNATAAINWTDLNLSPIALDLGFFKLRWYSLAYIAGILIGALGALVDSTVAQAAVVRELSNLNPNLDWRQLYKSGMGVGFDHIGSLVNTLVLANLGSSLPLWVVFTLGEVKFSQALNLELVATEIVHALVGCIGLILAVPLATLLAALLFRGGRHPGSDNVHGHAQVYNPQTRTEALIDA